MTFNLAVVLPAYLSGFSVPHVLLAFSTGLAAVVNGTLLYRGLRRQGIFTPSALWKRLLPQVLFASAVMAGFLWWSSGTWADWTGWGAGTRALRLAACVFGGENL